MASFAISPNPAAPFSPATQSCRSAVAERFAVDNAEAVGSTPQEYAAFIAKEQERWGEVVRKAGIKAN